MIDGLSIIIIGSRTILDTEGREYVTSYIWTAGMKDCLAERSSQFKLAT